ncbi:MAG: hypothetical protein ACQEQD_02470 [Bacillota bacterium]
MIENISNLYIKFLFIIILIIACFFSNNFFDKKIINYKNLIIAKQKEIKLEQEYKEKYFELEEKYNFEIFKKEEIIKNLNLIIDENNIEILNMEVNEKEEKILIKLKMAAFFNDINNFLNYLAMQKSFYDLNNILITKEENNNKLLIETEIKFRLSAYIEKKYHSTFTKKINNEIRNPYQLDIAKSYYVLNQKEEKIVMNLPIKLKGIISGTKEQLAIIEIKNIIKIIKPGFKNTEIEVVEINLDNISVKYEDLLFKINIGGNKGVIQ